MGREIGQHKLTAISAVANTVGGVAFALFGARIPSHYTAAIGELVIGAVGVLATPVVTTLFKVRSEAAAVRLGERRRALGMFAEFAYKLVELDPEHDLRVTLLEVDKSSTPYRLIQTVRYTCDGQVAPDDTSMYIHQGVAGRCYRTNKNVTFNFSGGDFMQHMVDLGFPEDEARRFRQRGAFLCSPVAVAGEVLAVLSIDAKTPEVFTPEHTAAVERLTPFFARLLIESENTGE